MQKPKMNLDLSKTSGVMCLNCKCEIFREVTILRRVPKMLIGELKDGIIQIPAYICANCEQIVDEMLPEQLRRKEPETTTPQIPGIKFLK